MKKIVIDYTKWRCSGEKELGTGATALCNIDGYMCCLGFATLQLAPELKNKLNRSDPEETGKLIPYLTEIDNDDKVCNTSLSDFAIFVNDDKEIPIAKKMEMLKELFLEHELELEFINVPE